MPRPRFVRTILLALSCLIGAPGQLQEARATESRPSEVRLTWMSIANWLFEVGDVRILMNGYITRIPQDVFTEGMSTRRPWAPDTPAIRRVMGALGEGKKIRFILTGHSHFDHSFDTATWARLTGAHIVGSRSTCLQAFAQGIPRSQCTVVNGGEVVTLGEGLTVRVIRWNHSGKADPPSDLHTPRELEGPPTPDPATGGLRAGIAEDFPNGGGARAYLFTLSHPQRRLSWFFSDTGGEDLDRLVIIEGVNFGAPRENLGAAMKAAGLNGVDLWIGYPNGNVVELVTPILKPRAFVPHHWDGLFSPLFAGLPFLFSHSGLEEFLAHNRIRLVVPGQYMDQFRLDRDGVTALPNPAVKERLGLPEVQFGLGTRMLKRFYGFLRSTATRLDPRAVRPGPGGN